MKLRGCRFWLRLCLAVLAVAAGVSGQAQTGCTADSWTAGAGKASIAWKASISAIRLTAHQRQAVDARVSITREELMRRHGSILISARVENQKGHWEERGRVQPGTGSGAEAVFAAFVEPGDYTFLVAACDEATLERVVARFPFHVGKLEPLPTFGPELPPVEFFPSSDSPEGWYLSAASRVRLAPLTATPPRVRLLVNMTPAESGRQIAAGALSHLRTMLPPLRLLSDMVGDGGHPFVRLLDTTRGRVIYERSESQPVDWPAMLAALRTTDPNVTDVAALQNRSATLRYFDGQIRDALTDEKAAVVVLSPPVQFGAQKPDVSTLASDAAGRRLFYVQYRQPPVTTVRKYQTPVQTHLGTGYDESVTPPNERSDLSIAMPPAFDDLEKILRPMGARVFHVSNAAEFRAALTVILRELAKL